LVFSVAKVSDVPAILEVHGPAGLVTNPEKIPENPDP
jgi:hypothetical protein